MESERSALIELLKSGKNQKETIIQIFQIREEFNITIKRFNETGSVIDKPRSGRFMSVTTRELSRSAACA